jgi:hypothetical protein
MELLCNAPAHASVPDRYVFPPEKRAALDLDGVDDGVTLPIVDLHRVALAGDDGVRRRVAAEIVRAGKEFGFFQACPHVVNSSAVLLLELLMSSRPKVLEIQLFWWCASRVHNKSCRPGFFCFTDFLIVV